VRLTAGLASPGRTPGLRQVAGRDQEAADPEPHIVLTYSHTRVDAKFSPHEPGEGLGESCPSKHDIDLRDVSSGDECGQVRALTVNPKHGLVVTG